MWENFPCYYGKKVVETEKTEVRNKQKILTSKNHIFLHLIQYLGARVVSECFLDWKLLTFTVTGFSTWMAGMSQSPPELKWQEDLKSWNDMRCTKPLQHVETINEVLVQLVTSVELICPSAICGTDYLSLMKLNNPQYSTVYVFLCPYCR